MRAVKLTTIFFVLLTGLSLSAWAADSDCARLLAPSFQSRELSTEEKFRAYMENLLEDAVLGYDELKSFAKALEEGTLANPVTEEVGLRNYEADVHRGSLQNYVERGKLDIERVKWWALERLEKMERDRSGQETVSEEIKEIADIDVTSRAFWEQVTDRYLKYISVGEKIPDSGGMEAIHFAVQHAPLETFKKFVDIHQKDLDVNARDNNGSTPLMYAAESGNPDAVSVLIKAGADVNAQNNDGWAPLIYAAESGNPDAVSVLIKAGADVNARNVYEQTPLIYAAKSGNPDAVSVLIKAGAAVNAQNNNGWTPLMYAAMSGNPDAVSVLIKAGADVNARKKYGLTPLMYAARSGNPDAVSVLIKAGAAVNAQNNDGWTPLMYAAGSGSPDAVSVLIKAGADVNAQNNNGQTPLMYAAGSGSPDAVSVLIKAGAKK